MRNNIGTHVTLSFKSEALLYDIKNYAFVEGDIMATDNEHQRHQTFDIGEEGNIDRVTRILGLAHSECTEMLFPYTKRIVADGRALDNALHLPDEYIIEMSLPEGFSMTTVELLKELIHEYMVCRVLSDWLSITSPGTHRHWEEKLDALRIKIQTCLVSRYGKIRRKLKPF